MGLDRHRVMEVFVKPVTGPGRVGSGYRVNATAVLTAGHVVTGLPVRSPAQVTAGAVIDVATRLGYPLSTTHVISGGVLGAGSTKSLSAVRWGIAGNIVVAWFLTIPAAALVAAAFYWPVEAIF